MIIKSKKTCMLMNTHARAHAHGCGKSGLTSSKDLLRN